MEELLTFIGFIILGYIIIRDKQKERKVDQLPKRVEEEEIDISKWRYDPKTKSFIENTQNIKQDPKAKEEKPLTFGEYHYAYKRASNTESSYRQVYKKASETKQTENKNNEKGETEYQNKTQRDNQTENKKPQKENSQSGNYYARQLLTSNELQAYAKLKSAADKQNLVICPKVRLADLVHPYKNDPKFMSHFGRIKSKHVDFVICNQRMDVVGIIELDDRSHDREDRKQRDQLVDDILESVGYKIIHTREITPNILDQFMRQ